MDMMAVSKCQRGKRLTNTHKKSSRNGIQESEKEGLNDSEMKDDNSAIKKQKEKKQMNVVTSS